MKRAIAAVVGLQVLLVAPAFGQKAKVEQLFREMNACMQGYTFAHQTVSPAPFTDDAIDIAVMSAQLICKDDELVATIYTGLKGGPDEKSLEEADRFVRDRIEKDVRSALAEYKRLHAERAAARDQR